MDFNPNYDYFLGAREEAGPYTVKKEDGSTEEKTYHYFLLNLATADMTTTDNTVSHCGFEVLGLGKSGYNNGDPIYKDWSKIKAEKISSVFGFDVPSADVLNKFVFKPCQIFFNKKGDISRIVFIEDAEKKGGK